ncbi:flagellar hook protein FlgE [Clostridiaceae bacterium HSG29]|nr:flagellar hook protein FlgE [Clostridiaceae bacterium HSG29]
MMRSLYAAVSGLRVHQTKMDVIGNNIANVNTVGFKGSTVTFKEVFSQTVKGAGSPTDGKGGTNPQQIGLGVGMGSISVNHSKGSTQRTDNPTDLMIDGNGFFVVTNDANAQNKFYTRAGNFNVDRNGNLVTTEGYKVLDTDMKPVQINKSDTKEATETDQLLIQGNVNSGDEDYTTTVDVYDSLGGVHTIDVNFIGDAVPIEFDPALLPDSTDDPKYSAVVPIPDGYYAGGANQDYFLKRVSITNDLATNLNDGVGARTDLATFAAAEDVYALFNEDGQVVDYVQVPTDPTAGTPATMTSFSGTLTLNLEGADDLDLDINRKMFFQDGLETKSRTFTQYSQETDAKTVAFDGNSAGSINSFNISSKGEVVGVYTNGERETLAVITLADFDNPAGLEKIGSNMFIDTNNSGTPKYGQPSTGSFGALNPGALEMSNVDLSKQFTEMITTQRGFQANSRVISTSDEILQELVNLKR